MDSGPVGRGSNSRRASQGSHVIWGSVRGAADDVSTSDMACHNDLSGSALENVVYRDWSTSHSSFSGMKSNRNEPTSNADAEAAEALSDSWTGQAVSEEAKEFMMKHGVWSAGTAGHVAGLCKPCHFVHTQKGCKSGANCEFCHLPHVGPSESGNRPSKEKRELCKALLGSPSAFYGNRLDKVNKMLKFMSSQSAYMQKLLTSSDEGEPEEAPQRAKEHVDPVLCQVQPSGGRALRARTAHSMLKDILASNMQEQAVAGAAAMDSTAPQ